VIPLSLDGATGADAVSLLLSGKMRADFTSERSFHYLSRVPEEIGPPLSTSGSTDHLGGD
jgi:hypothetical protein